MRPAHEAQIAPKIMSNVAAVYVREGDYVSHGQALVKLESADLSAQEAQARAALTAAAAQAQAAKKAVVLQKAQTSVDIARAQAELAAATEQLAIAKKGPRRQERSQAHLMVVQAQAQFKNSKIEIDRMKTLSEQGAVPRQRLDQAETAYEVATAQYEAAKEQADLVEEGSRLEEIRAAQARVRQAEEALRLAKASVVQNTIREEDAKTATSEVGRASAALAFARVQRSYAAITSPMNGIVTARLVDPGDTVSPGVPILVVEDNSRYRLDVTVAESELPLLETGGTVEVRIDAGGLETTGHVAEIVPSGDPGSRKFLVKVNLPADVNVKTGQFGRINFPKTVREAVTVPREAIRDDTGLTSVLVAGEDGRAHLRVVKAGRTYGGRTEIISGLSEDERVIISNETGLADGVPVTRRRA